ncbi:hypothetical protein [Mitsuaria sp. 7]|uniref:hypothetical protein n=1 Tax=Mitsuaria sp. 7 TaxID=1658665 RepID=UPI0007DE2F32|nr:hypothetical protein [Mitsuaria sp. 7]ANH68849.1 hypothetical protein ABE85_17005 [Mitsuaria sp. 7]
MHATTRPSRLVRTDFLRAASRITVGAVFAVMTAGAAQAAPDDLQRVEISGRRPGEIPRTDVRATCPGVDKALDDRLSRVQFFEGKEGLSTVSFRLNGNVISEVQDRGPLAYRTALRRAVRALQCQGAARDTLYVMQVSFRNEDARDDMGGRIALLEMAPPAAGSAVGAASAAMVDGR